MSQHGMTIPNQAGASFRADLNNMALALVTASSGATAPTTTYAFQFWADTTSGLLKQRNSTNSAWITVSFLSNWALASSQIQAATASTTTGTSVAYAIATAPTQPSLQPDQRYRVKLHTPNGASPTLSRDGLAAKAIMLYNVIGGKTAPGAGQLPTLSDAEYDGVDYVVLNPLPATGGATGAGGDTVFVENSRVVNNSYSLTINKSASMVGPLVTATGKSTTVQTGERLVVL